MKIKDKNNLVFGILLMGATGLAMGWVVHSPMLMVVAGGLGAAIGGLIGWLGGRLYLLVICFGVLLGAYLGDLSGDRDILIMAAGTGGAIGGFLGNLIEMFVRKR
jgi:MFS family permease